MPNPYVVVQTGVHPVQAVIPWHDMAVGLTSNILPGAPTPVPEEDQGWSEALADLYRMFQASYAKREHYITRWQERVYKAGAGGERSCTSSPMFESGLLHTHPGIGAGSTSITDVNNSYTWSADTMREGLASSSFMPGDLRENYLLSKGENRTLEISVYWRLYNDPKPWQIALEDGVSCNDPGSLTMNDQVGIVTFTRWSEERPHELLFSDTALRFELGDGDLAWLSFTTLFRTLLDGSATATARRVDCHKSPDMDDRTFELSVKYFKRGLFRPRPRFSITTPMITCILSPRCFFDAQFDWEAELPDKPFWRRSLDHFLGQTVP